MRTSKIIFIIIILLELNGFLLFSINLASLLNPYTDLFRTNRILCAIIGFIMILIGGIIIFALQMVKHFH